MAKPENVAIGSLGKPMVRVGYGPFARWQERYPSDHEGEGVKRAKERLKKKRKANQSISSGSMITRQQQRQQFRTRLKALHVTPAERGRRRMKDFNAGRCKANLQAGKPIYERNG